MKTIIISCNYFAKSENRLKNCLESLKMIKLPNTIILMGDNNSTDGSVELIQEYVDNGTVDVFYKSPKNIGKAKMLNLLYYIAKTKIGVEPNDVLMHIDSDITVKTENYLSIVEDYYEKILNKEIVNAIIPYQNDLKEQWFLFDVNKIQAKNEFGHIVKTTNNYHIAGGCFSTLCKYHEMIGGYTFKQGVNGYPIYGGDDAFYMLYLNNIVKGNFKTITSLKVSHIPESDKEFRKWKRTANWNIAHGVQCNAKGFFDK